MSATRVLLAEDDESLGSLLKEYLKAKSYQTDWALNGKQAYDLLKKSTYDICILDVMMPVKDGFTLASEMRQEGNETPIIFLTAKSMKEDIFEGFTAGADDYITKPFSMEELIFRIEAILRRLKKGLDQQDQTQFNIGKLNFDANKQLLSVGDKEYKLTTKESDLLRLLCIHKNSVLERNYALKEIWIDDNYFNARSMDVYITKLRKYLSDDPSIQIMNIHGKGFKLLVD
jgi:two-component system, OmpR family, response regulator